MTIEGGCLCGAVRYRVSRPLLAARSCHCSRCRKAFSGAGSAYAEVERGSFVWTGGESRLGSFQSQDGFGLLFCGTCGTTLAGTWGTEVHGVTLGPIDGDPGVEIGMHIFVGSKAPWDHIGGSAPRFDERPPSEE